jgi:catechol 2,3-dioxygenase-like lactoylglutathione lyase family enzyme
MSRIIGPGQQGDQQESGMSISAIIPQLRTTNLDASLDFYVGKLGFALEFRHGDFYAGIGAGGQTIHLKLVDAQDPSIAFVSAGDHLHLYFTTDDVDAEAARLQRNGVTLRGVPVATAWGTREFSIVDDQGHLLYFGQPMEQR